MNEKGMDKRFLEAIDAEDAVLQGDWKQTAPIVDALAQTGLWFLLLHDEYGFALRFDGDGLLQAIDEGRIAVRYVDGAEGSGQ